MTAKLTTKALIILALAVALQGCRRDATEQEPQKQSEQLPEYGKDASAESEYQAVLLIDGMVLFGKLHGIGTAYPVLTDVYYVQTVQDPQTKQPKSVLLKRGKEWHAPDRAFLNSSQIVLIEPVTKYSKVMQIIEAEQKKKGSAQESDGIAK